MLFTWNTENLCIVFKSWHIRSTAGLIFSLLAVVLLGMGYEALRAGTRRYEIVMRRRVNNAPSESAPGFIMLPNSTLSEYNICAPGFSLLPLLLQTKVLLVYTRMITPRGV